MKSFRILLFVVAVAAQIMAPALMIRFRETTLREGAQFRFRVAPVDPYDAFRGRYIFLRVESNCVPAIPGVRVSRGTMLCAEIGMDTNGFAYFTAGSVEPPVGTAFKCAGPVGIPGQYLARPADGSVLHE